MNSTHAATPIPSQVPRVPPVTAINHQTLKSEKTQAWAERLVVDRKSGSAKSGKVKVWNWP
ncbi:hypothetical protein QNM99_16295 [Pseudomonas sp. PCH446]